VDKKAFLSAKYLVWDFTKWDAA